MKNILELLKKNLAIVICMVVAIGAVIANYIPLGGFRDDLKSRAEARKAQYDAIEKVMSQPRTMPNLDPSATEAKPLEGFPTARKIEQGKAVSEKFLKAAGGLMDAANALNEKKPLVPGALPNGEFVQGRQFIEEYKRVTDMSPGGRNGSMPVTLMKAGFAPTQDDFTRRSEEAKLRATETTAVFQGNQIINQQQVEAAIAAEISQLQDSIVKDVAKTIKVYIDPTTMDVQQAIIGAVQPPEPSVIYWAQAALWAQEDLFRAVADINNSATDVTQSPIKYLISARVPLTFIGITAGPSSDPNAPPSTPSADPNVPLQPKYTAAPTGSPTGRVSNGVYDVLHIDVSMIVEAEKLPMVLNQLGRGRLLNVVQVRSVLPQDVKAFENFGMELGTKPVVRVDMVLENLLLRKWTVQYMPRAIKMMLGVPLEGAPDPAAAPPPG